MTPRTLVAGLALLGGAALCVIGWPRFVAGAIIAPYEDQLKKAARGQNVTTALLNDAIQRSKVSSDWVALGKSLNLLGGLELLAARSASSPIAQQRHLDASIAALRDGLARAPANAYSWVQLAQSVRARRGATPAVNGPLRLSLKTAPFEHRLVLPRIDLALTSWRVIEPDIRLAMAVQFQRAVDTAPVQFARMTRRRFALRQVRRALEASPIHLERFNIVYLTPD